MPNELQKKGAQSSKPTRYGVLWNNTFYNGVITQRNPLRGAAAHVEEEFYGSRYDTLIDGQNCEISTKLTLVRRPGLSVYNSQTFPAINRFYENRTFLYNSTQTILSENIQIVADTASVVYDCTGPSTKTTIFTKSSGAGSSYFQSVGNSLYFSDGPDQKKLMTPNYRWSPGTSVPPGTVITSGTAPGILQMALGGITLDITASACDGSVFTIWTDIGGIPKQFPNLQGASVKFAGLTAGSALNGNTYAATILSTTLGILQVTQSASSYSSTSDTGTATTGSGTTGGTTPSFSGVQFAITQDSGQQWKCYGSSVQNWGLVSPTIEPTLSTGPGGFFWQPNQQYVNSTGSSKYFAILDSNNSIELLVVPASTTYVTGLAMPTWSTSIPSYTTGGGQTKDGTAIWQNCGPLGSWSANTVYFPFSAILDINGNLQFVSNGGSNPSSSAAWQTGSNSDGNWATPVNGPTTQWAENVTLGSGDTSITFPIAFSSGTQISVNVTTVYPSGDTGFLSVVAGSTTSTGFTIHQSNLTGMSCNWSASGYVSTPSGTGSSSGYQPSWATTTGDTTSDGALTWTCVGPGAIITTAPVEYSFSLHSLDGSVSTASPLVVVPTGTIGTAVAKYSIFQYWQLAGTFAPDVQYDQIWIWRTVQGGSVLFLEDQIPVDTFASGNFTYSEIGVLDTSLDEFIQAPIASSSNPPPKGLAYLAYHLGCVWGAVGNIVYYSDGPLVTSGNGNTAWNPLNYFQFPGTVFRLVPTSNGLLVFTASNVYIIQGTNTTNSPLFSTPFLPKYLGLLSYDAFDINGTLIYMYTSDNQIVTLDPSSGISEIGFPIGDQFGPGNGTGTFTPTSTRITWHVDGSQDKALYVSDFEGTWWRMLPTPSPETGTTWCPMAEIIGGFSAVQSVETVPGTHKLLVGPQTSGPILVRDYSTYTDNGSSYDAWAVLGSLVLAQPGQLAEVESFTTDSRAIGTPITLKIQLDEISSFTGLATIAPNNPGTGYTVGDIISVVYSGTTEEATAEVTSITGLGPTGSVNGLSLLTYGDGYALTGTGLATTGGTGSGLTVNTTYGGLFETLDAYVPDPTQLEPSKTVYAQRFYVSQTQEPAVCRHLQLLVDWGRDTVKNELLSLSLYGSYSQEK